MVEESLLELWRWWSTISHACWWTKFIHVLGVPWHLYRTSMHCFFEVWEFSKTCILGCNNKYVPLCSYTAHAHHNGNSCELDSTPGVCLQTSGCTIQWRPVAIWTATWHFEHCVGGEHGYISYVSLCETIATPWVYSASHTTLTPGWALIRVNFDFMCFFMDGCSFVRLRYVCGLRTFCTSCEIFDMFTILPHLMP